MGYTNRPIYSFSWGIFSAWFVLFLHMSYLSSGLQILYLDAFILLERQKQNCAPTLIWGVSLLESFIWSNEKHLLVLQVSVDWMAMQFDELSLLLIKRSLLFKSFLSILMVSIAFLLPWKQKQNLLPNITHILVYMLRSTHL